MTAIVVFCALSILLVLGKLLRMKFRLLQRLYLPSSVIGGLLGLAVVQLCGSRMPAEVVGGAQKLPSFLINVIFATLFLGTATPKFRQAWRMALPQLCMGQLLAWGQYVIGLGLVGFLLCRFFDVPPAMGNLVEIGFEGGHGNLIHSAHTLSGVNNGTALASMFGKRGAKIFYDVLLGINTVIGDTPLMRGVDLMTQQWGIMPEVEDIHGWCHFI